MKYFNKLTLKLRQDFNLSARQGFPSAWTLVCDGLLVVLCFLKPHGMNWNQDQEVLLTLVNKPSSWSRLGGRLYCHSVCDFYFLSAFLWTDSQVSFSSRYTKGELDIAYITSRIIGKHGCTLDKRLCRWTLAGDYVQKFVFNETKNSWRSGVFGGKIQGNKTDWLLQPIWMKYQQISLGWCCCCW